MSQQAEIDVGSSRGSRALENALTTLWEKARRASEIILGLREENRILQKKAADLEAELAAIKQSLDARSQEMRSLKEQFSVLQSHNNDSFSKEEKEALKAKIQELILKIDSYL